CALRIASRFKFIRRPHKFFDYPRCALAVEYALMLIATLFMLASPPMIELSVDRVGAPDMALVVHIRNGTGHRPIALLREFWKFESVQCALTRDGQPVPHAFSLRPDRPTLAQLVVLEATADYGERLELGRIWSKGALLPGAYRAECHISTRVALEKVF